MPAIMPKCQHGFRPARFGKRRGLCENIGRFIVNASEMYGLVTHYSTNGLDSACGRSSQSLVSTIVADGVSCKSCQRSLVKAESSATVVRKSPSLAELRKSAKTPAVATTSAPVARPAVVSAPRPVSGPALQAPAEPARAGGFSVKAAWAARLAEQAGQHRLPRGKAKQRKV